MEREGEGETKEKRKNDAFWSITNVLRVTVYVSRSQCSVTYFLSFLMKTICQFFIGHLPYLREKPYISGDV